MQELVLNVFATVTGFAVGWYESHFALRSTGCARQSAASGATRSGPSRPSFRRRPLQRTSRLQISFKAA